LWNNVGVDKMQLTSQEGFCPVHKKIKFFGPTGIVGTNSGHFIQITVQAMDTVSEQWH